MKKDTLKEVRALVEKKIALFEEALKYRNYLKSLGDTTYITSSNAALLQWIIKECRKLLASIKKLSGNGGETEVPRHAVLQDSVGLNPPPEKSRRKAEAENEEKSIVGSELTYNSRTSSETSEPRCEVGVRGSPDFQKDDGTWSMCGKPALWICISCQKNFCEKHEPKDKHGCRGLKCECGLPKNHRDYPYLVDCIKPKLREAK